MKKQGSMMLVICIILCTMISYADQGDQPISVLVNGEQLDFDVNPITENDRTLVPMRMIFEALGAEVTWDDETNTARAVKEALTIEITIDQMYLLKNGSKVALDVPARLVNNRTLVPIRAISEGLDAKVEWNEELKQVIITTKEEVITPTPSPSIKPSALPSPSPTPTVKPTASPTPTVKPTTSPSPNNLPEEYYFTQLSKKDVKKLQESYEIIRFTFEQQTLPKFILENEKLHAPKIRAKNDQVNDAIKYAWNSVVAASIYQIQTESESIYSELPHISFISVENHYLSLINSTKMNAGKFFTCTFKVLKNQEKSTMVLIIFNETDTPMACKFIGIVAKNAYKNDMLRYFTAETGIVGNKNFNFCEVDKTGKKTLGKIGLEQDDFLNAVSEKLNMDEGSI